MTDVYESQCWICLSSEIEESSGLTPSGERVQEPLRKVCGCSLAAHDTCLNRWISTRRQSGDYLGQITPHCGYAYKFSSNTSYFFPAIYGIDRHLTKYSPVIGLFGMTLCTYIGTLTYGLHTINSICGPNMLHSLLSAITATRRNIMIESQLLLGLPMIPIWLIGSRFHFMDSILPALPPLVLGLPSVTPTEWTSHVTNRNNLILPINLTLYTLPWLRVIYNTLWDRFIKPLEMGWNIAPSGSSSVNSSIQEQQNDTNNNAILNVFRFNAHLEMRLDNETTVANENTDLNNQVVNHIDTLDFNRLCRLCVGALLFPDIASFMGTVLEKIPWVKARVADRFSLSILGGCFFILIKDCIYIYYRYQRFRFQRSVRLLSYSGIK